MKKILLAGAILSTMTIAMASDVKTNGEDFTKMKAKCTKVVSDTLECMNKATKPMEVKVCKMEMKKEFLEMKIDMMKSGKMHGMMEKKGKMSKMKAGGKCATGKCGGK